MLPPNAKEQKSASTAVDRVSIMVRWFGILFLLKIQLKPETEEKRQRKRQERPQSTQKIDGGRWTATLPHHLIEQLGSY
jgi:hypothetical protein